MSGNRVEYKIRNEINGGGHHDLTRRLLGALLGIYNLGDRIIQSHERLLSYSTGIPYSSLLKSMLIKSFLLELGTSDAC